MDAKHKAVIDKICRLSSQNKEFNTALRAHLLGREEVASHSLDTNRLDHIYEYCIERVVRHQAMAFYDGFPIPSIIPQLVEDYVRMEYFRRKDSFVDFSLALYQQVECITNHLCKLPDLAEVVKHLWGHAAYVDKKDAKGLCEQLTRRCNSNYQVAHLIFFGYDKQVKKDNALVKSRKQLPEQSAVDKMRIVVYFLGHGTVMASRDYESYVNETNLLRDLYQCRNMNHRGDQTHDWQQDILDRILPQRSIYYFKFLGLLVQYVEYVRSGMENLPIILEYAKNEKPLSIRERKYKGKKKDE